MNGNKCLTDSNIFVNAFVELDKARNEASRELLEKTEQGSLQLFTNFLVLAETFYIIEKYKNRETARKVMKELLSLNNLLIIPVDHTTFYEAFKRSKKYKLKFNDLIHYTTALLNNADGIYSYDKDFEGLEIKRMEP